MEFLIAFLVSVGLAVIVVALGMRDVAKREREKLATYEELEIAPEEAVEKPKRKKKKRVGVWGAILLANERLARTQTAKALYSETRSLGQIRQRLRWAGDPYNLSPEEFVALRITCCFLFTAVGVVLYFIIGIMPLWAVAVFLVFGYAYPKLWLDRLVKQRQAQIVKSLPELIDMLLIIVEAKSWAEAINEAPRYIKGPLRKEIKELNRNILPSGDRVASLMKFAENTGIPEVRALAYSLAHAEIVGQSMGDALKNQAESIRVAHWQQIDAEIGKTTTLLAFPMVFLLLPAMILVALVPSIQILLQQL